MKVLVAKTAGFCFGVDRAISQVYNNLEQMPLYTYGPIIHNAQVVENLEKNGVKVINDLSELDNKPNGTVIIRSHGVGEKIYIEIQKRGFNVMDATCPYVKRIHKIVNEYSNNGYKVVIIGDNKHPEVIGIKGWSVSETIVVESIDDANNIDIPNDKPLCIVAQTTFNYIKFEEIIEILRTKGYVVDIKETICSATEERQKEALELSSKADKMIVIGGKHSSNTQKLYNLCKNQCDKTYHIETIEDLELNVFNDDDIIGITAGASTPKNIIEEVIVHVRSTERKQL